METSITVRNAKLSDAPRILEIYTYYVENTVITFEYDVPSLEEFENRMMSSRSIWITMQRNAGLAENSMKLWLIASKIWAF